MPKTGAAVAKSAAAGKKASTGTFEKGAFAVQGHQLTPQEFVAVAKYQGHYYQDVNHHLRGTEFAHLANPEGVAQIPHLDSLAARTTLKHDTTLYRGIQHYQGFDPATLGPGSVISDKAFFSTSLSKSAAQGFTDELAGKGLLLTIRAPAGTKHIPVHAIGTGSTFQHSEKEVLLGRGTQVRIKSIRKTRSGVYHAQAEIL